MLIAYAVFATAILTAAIVDAVEQRIPDLVTYPLLAVGAVGLPWLGGRSDLWMLLAPAIGAALSGFWALLSALIGDQGLGNVKLAAAIGAWMAYLGILPWAVGVAVGQILMVVVGGRAMLHRRKRGLPHAHTAMGATLTAGASSRSRWPVRHSEPRTEMRLLARVLVKFRAGSMCGSYGASTAAL